MSNSLSPRADDAVRNLVIGGNFDFWQRGIGPTTLGAGITYLADRFGSAQSGYASTTQQRSTDVPTQAQSGFNSLYSLLVTNSTGAAPSAAQYQVVSHSLEGQDYQQLHGKKARLQFWVKSNVIGTYTLNMRNPSATRNFLTTYSVTAINTWQKISIDLSFDNLGSSWAFDNTTGVQIIWTLTSGSNYQSSGALNTWNTTAGVTSWGITGQQQWGATTGATFQIAQIMLIPQDFTQAGSATVDIPFQRAGRTIGDELRMCQRYFQQEGVGALNYQSRLTTVQSNSTAVFMYSNLIQTMRTAPIATLIGTRGTNWFLRDVSGNTNITGSVTNNSSTADPNTSAVVFNSGTYTAGLQYHIQGTGTGVFLVNYDAEL